MPGPRIGGFDVAGGCGVGVGTTATIGLLGVGVADGTCDGSTDAGATDADGSSDPLGSGDVGGSEPVTLLGCGSPELDEEDVVAVGAGGLTAAELAGVGELPAAIPVPGWAGATNPAVSATVARTRFRRPNATTRRARWAEVTTTGGLLQAGQRESSGTGAMVAEGPRQQSWSEVGTGRPVEERAGQPRGVAARSRYRARPDPVMDSKRIRRSIRDSIARSAAAAVRAATVAGPARTPSARASVR